MWDNTPSKPHACLMCAIEAVTNPPDEAVDQRKGGEGTLFVLPGMDRSNAHLPCLVQPGWKMTLLPHGFRHISDGEAHL